MSEIQSFNKQLDFKVYKPEIKIKANRWGDTNGNMYHSCYVEIDGMFMGYEPFTYGFGDCYLQTALNIVQKVGFFNTGKRMSSGASQDLYDFSMYLRDKSKCVCIVQDVKRKKDLAM